MDLNKKCQDAINNLIKCHQYLHQDENKLQFYSCTVVHIPDYIKYCGIKEPLLLSSISPTNIHLNLNS